MTKPALRSITAMKRARDVLQREVRGRQGDLASLVGASRVRVNQALVMLKKRGGISTDQYHHITVHDEDVLARIGIVNVQQLRAWRGYFIVVAFVVAAIVTPPDVISQLALAIPMVILYELGIIFSKVLLKEKLSSLVRSMALLSLLTDLLDLSKLDAGRLELEQRPFALALCVDEAIELIAPAAARRPLDVVVRGLASAPPKSFRHTSTWPSNSADVISAQSTCFWASACRSGRF